MQQYPSEPTGNLARHLTTLAALVCGIVGSKQVHLPAIAGKWPDKSKKDSRAKRFTRFLQNKSVTLAGFFVPFAQALLESLPPGPLVLVMDGSRKRALPLCWQVVKTPKGHFTQDAHRELLAQARALIPAGRPVIFLGDGEFEVLSG